MNSSVVSGTRLSGLNAHVGSSFGNRGSSFGNRGGFGSSFGSGRGFGNGFRGGFGNGFRGGFRGGFRPGFGFGRFGFFPGFGFGFNPFFFGGCWGCGFGWGFGWNPWWGGYPYYPYPYWGGYGYSGYDDSGSYSSDMSYNNNVGAYSADNNTTSADQFAQSDLPYTDQGTDNPNPVTGNVAATTPTVLIYLTDGTAYAASDYWLADGKLHFTVNYAGQNSIDMNQVDLQRTVNENAKRGVRFSLKANPDTSSATPRSNTNTAGASPNNQQNRSTPATNPPAPQPLPRTQLTSQPSTSQL
jgi:hypothetical protein